MRRSGIHPSHMSEHDMRRMNLSDDLDAEPSEYCWGAGLEPPSVRGRHLHRAVATADARRQRIIRDLAKST